MKLYNCWIFFSLFFIVSCSDIKVLKPSLVGKSKLLLDHPSKKVIVTEKKRVQPHLLLAKDLIKVEKTVKQRVPASRKNKIENFTLHYPHKIFKFWTHYFTKRERTRFIRHMKNGKGAKKVVDRILKSHHLPVELFYVALIESGYNKKIRSRADAVGPWQFIKGTATRYGLRVDKYVDERYSLVKSTHAAAKYFKDLYNIFGSWELALCAYNAGEYRIINAIRRGNTRDYRTLVRRKLLPKETIFYIPKVAAAKALFEKPRAYSLPVFRQHDRSYDGLKKIKLTQSFKLSKIASKNNLSLTSLKKWNVDIKRNFIRVSKYRPYSLYVPLFKKIVYKGQRYHDRKTARLEKNQGNKSFYYKVKVGDHLTKIARKYNVSVRRLKIFNKLSTSRLLVGQKIKIPISSKGIQIHHVKRGDNLIKISKKYRVSVAEIMKKNNLQSKRIFTNQKIKIPL